MPRNGAFISEAIPSGSLKALRTTSNRRCCRSSIASFLPAAKLRLQPRLNRWRPSGEDFRAQLPTRRTLAPVSSIGLFSAATSQTSAGRRDSGNEETYDENLGALEEDHVARRLKGVFRPPLILDELSCGQVAPGASQYIVIRYTVFHARWTRSGFVIDFFLSSKTVHRGIQF